MMQKLQHVLRLDGKPMIHVQDVITQPIKKSKHLVMNLVLSGKPTKHNIGTNVNTVVEKFPIKQITY